jgi:IS4 transposase
MVHYPIPAGSMSVRSDQIIQLTAFYGRKAYPSRLRRIRCYDAENKRSLVFLTNHFGLPAAVISELYRQRWQVELFFKWIKQHLRSKAFYGRSENAVRTQIWVALCVYALVAIARKQTKSQRSLFEILQVLSVSVFDKTPMKDLFLDVPPQNSEDTPHNQLTLFL